MYGIESADRFKTKKIAGKIVPAIATTTAAVSGLVSAELVKIVKGCKLDAFKNVFMNQAVPIMVVTRGRNFVAPNSDTQPVPGFSTNNTPKQQILSEPAEAEKTKLAGGQSFTLWDRWEIDGSPAFTLAEFLKAFEVCGVVF